MEITSRVPIVRVLGREKESVEDIVTHEYTLRITVGSEKLVAFLCSPADLEFLVAGFLFSEGVIESKSDILALEIDIPRGEAKAKVKKEIGHKSKQGNLSLGTVASGGARSSLGFASGQASLYSTKRAKQTLKMQTVYDLMQKFTQSSKVFKDTGGVHSAALASDKGIIYLAEDIGRHNALEKVFGYALLKEIDLSNKFILTSGRVSSEILLKTARRNVSFLISKSAPTDEGVKFASEFDITLVGFVRGERMNIYSHSWRIE